MEQKFLTRKQKRKMERKQKKEKMNEYYMKRFSKNKFNKNNNKFKQTTAYKEEAFEKNKKSKQTTKPNKKNNNILFNDEKIDISDIDLEKIDDKKSDKKEDINIKEKKEKDDIDLDLEYLEKKLNLKNSDIMDKYKKSMALENYDADIFDFLDNIDSSVQKGIDKYKKYDPNTYNKKIKDSEVVNKKNEIESEEENEEEEEDEFENMEEGEELEDDNLNEELEEGQREDDELEEEEEEDNEDNEDEEENENNDEKYNKKEKKEKEEKKEIIITKEMKQQNIELMNQFKKELTSLLNKVAESNLSLILPALFNKISSFIDSYKENDKKVKTKITYEIISEILIKTIINQQVINLPIISCICSIISLLHLIKFGQSFLFFFIKKCLEEINYLKENANIPKYKYKNFFFIVIHLYIFENINSVFVYDLIKYLIDNFDENNSEYLLLLLSYTGINIRKENPTNLKDIISLINKKYNDIKISNDSNKTEKIKYIIDMINDIKQNKYLKFNLQEKFNFFKEIIKKNKSDNIVLSDKLELELNKITKIPYDQILSEEIISNSEKIEEIINLDTDDLIIKETQEDDKTNAQLNKAMKKLGISTKLKKMIFINIATSSGVNDAFERLNRLNLNKEQRREIVKMIIKLCIEEPSYNPFYQLLMEKLLTLDKDNKYTFHYCIWDYMKILENFKIKKIHNLSKLTANLLLKEKISIPVLLQFKFEEDKNENKIFVNMVFNRYFEESDEDKTKLIFAKLVKNDDHVEFAQKLFNYFAKEFSRENNVEQKNEKYQANLGSALKVLKKVL